MTKLLDPLHGNTLAMSTGSHSIHRISQKCSWIIFEGVLTAQLASNDAEGFDSEYLPSSLHSGDKTKVEGSIN